MKKMITKTGLFLLSILWIGNISAQDLLIDDFESGNKGWATVACYQDIRNNPHKEGINTSDKVLFTNRGTGNPDYSGAILPADNLAGSPITGYRYLHAKMYRNNANNPQLKITDGSGAPEINPMSGITIVANQWQDVVFDIGTYPVDYVMFMVDRSATLAAEAQLLVDDIILNNNSTPRTEDVSEPVVIGSMIGTGLPLYPQRNGAAPGTAVAGVTFDFKLVSVGSKTFAWTGSSQAVGTSGAGWESQLRYWEPAKTELNLTGRADGNKQTFGNARLPNVNPLTVTFFQSWNNQFYETDDFTYDYTIANSADAGDNTAPVLDEPIIVNQTAQQLQLSLSATDDSGNFFYYIEDAANNFAEVSFFNETTLTLTPDVDYNFSIYAIDFSGNQSEAKIVSTEAVEVQNITEGTAKDISFKLDSRSLTELKIEATSNSLIGDAFVKMAINGVPVLKDNGDDKEWKPTIDQNVGVNKYQITVPAAEVPGWEEGAILSLNLGYIVMPIGDWGHYVTENKVITEGENNGLPILHKIGTGVDIEEPEPEPEYVCENNLLDGVGMTLVENADRPFYAPGWDWSRNYDYTVESVDGEINIFLPLATVMEWQAQFEFTFAEPIVIDNAKKYGISVTVETDKSLPFYVKFMDGSDDVNLDVNRTVIDAGTATVSAMNLPVPDGLTQITRMLFDFGTNTPETSADNVTFKISDITLCDQMTTLGINDVAINAISVYPVPADNVLYINGIDQPAVARVFDLTGKTVIVRQTDGELNVSNLSSGIYILNIENKMVKFVKK